MKGNKMKKEKKFNVAYLTALVPLVSTAIYIALLMLPDKFIKLGSIAIWNPIGQQNVSELSLLSVLIVAGAIYAWGACGAFAAKHRTGMLSATLVAHIIPIISLAAYTVLKLIAAFGGGSSAGDTADVFALGFGVFNIVGSIIYQIVAVNVVEVLVDTAVMAGTFIIGYSIGTEKKKNK